MSHLKKQEDEVSVSPQIDYQNTADSSPSGYSNSPASHYRSAKRVSRSRVKKRSDRALGMCAVATGIPVGSVAVPFGSSSGDSLRERHESPSTSVLLPISGPGGEAMVIDSLRSDWPDEVLYFFPPACVLFHFLQRCQKTDRRILLVLP